MTKDKIVALIKKRIKKTKEEYEQQWQRYEQGNCRMVFDSSWYIGKIRAYNEALEVIGMLDKDNNK